MHFPNFYQKTYHIAICGYTIHTLTVSNISSNTKIIGSRKCIATKMFIKLQEQKQQQRQHASCKNYTLGAGEVVEISKQRRSDCWHANL